MKIFEIFRLRKSDDTMLKVLTVYRYRSSGKLVAAGLGNRYVLSLNSDLTFSEREPHRVRLETELDETPYRIEVEVGAQGKHDTYRIVRRWNESELSPKSDDPGAPLELRIDISPSQELGEAERRYIGKSAGHPIGFLLVLGSLLLLFLAGIWGWWPALIAFIAGVVVIWTTTTPGDESKKREVIEAKERLRVEAARHLLEAMRDVREWAALDGIAFEFAVGRIYRERGFDVEFTPRTNDQGVDLILKRNGAVSIVQCKAFGSNVGVAAVRELVGVRASWPHAEEAILVALFDFSSPAKRFAEKHGIVLFSVARDYLKSDYRPKRYDHS
jgi:hypothetical protein